MYQSRLQSCSSELCVDKTENGGNSNEIPSSLKSERIKDYANSLLCAHEKDMSKHLPQQEYFSISFPSKQEQIL